MTVEQHLLSGVVPLCRSPVEFRVLAETHMPSFEGLIFHRLVLPLISRTLSLGSPSPTAICLRNVFWKFILTMLNERFVEDLSRSIAQASDRAARSVGRSVGRATVSLSSVRATRGSPARKIAKRRNLWRRRRTLRLYPGTNFFCFPATGKYPLKISRVFSAGEAGFMRVKS